MKNDETYLESRFESIKEEIKEEYDLSNISFNTWLVPLRLLEYDGDNAAIGIPREKAQALNYIDSHYRDFFCVKISEVMGHPVNVSFALCPPMKKRQTENDDSTTLGKEAAAAPGQRKSTLNAKYTFDNFVVGKNNAMAQAAALAVAESPGDLYNPLFLYSDAGMGKTHLMHAIGNFVEAHNPQARVLYVTSEAFTNEIIASIRSNNSQEQSRVRRKYRDVDILMVDDVQFIIGKDSTQEEFFHTFNELHNAGKHIILSSDKPPKDMVTLEERFRSRFEWGLIVDIQPPDYETRMAILQKNAENYPGHIDDEVLNYIANNVKTNIRELEGAFNKVTARFRILGEDIDITKAEDALIDFISEKDNTITPQRIIDKTCEYYGITREAIASKKRSKEIALPRQVAMYHIRLMTDTSYDEIGKLLGGRDHTTVMSAINKIKEQVQKDVKLENQVLEIKQMIKPER